MRFTSLVVELIRARPRLVVWLVVLLQAALWLILPVLLYRSPPGDLATVLAFGREYQVGTYLGPPLAFWLADIAFRAVGNHMFGVYLLAQLCAIATFWTFYQLARAIVGGQQAVLAVLLSMTVVAFSSPGVEFGPLVLARPLWALLLLHSWQIIGQNRRSAWFAWSIEAGLLLLTTSAAIGLLLLIVGFAVATVRGRRTLMSLDPLYALLVIVVLALPWLIWLLRADVLTMPPWPAIDDLGARAALGRAARRPGAGDVRHRAAGGAQLRLVRPQRRGSADHLPAAGRSAGAPVRLLLCDCPGAARKPDRGPVQSRPRRRRCRRRLADVGACRDRCDRRPRLSPAPAAAALGLGGGDRRACFRGDRDHACSCPGPACDEVPTSLPAKAIARFFGDSFERRTNQRLRAVTGDPQLASFIAMDSGRPHLLLDATPERTPWLSAGEIQRDRRRRGLARRRYRGHAAARTRATLSRPGAGSAARVRMDGERKAAAAAGRLGHRAAEGAVDEDVPPGLVPTHQPPTAPLHSQA